MLYFSGLLSVLVDCLFGAGLFLLCFGCFVVFACVYGLLVGWTYLVFVYCNSVGYISFLICGLLCVMIVFSYYVVYCLFACCWFVLTDGVWIDRLCVFVIILFNLGLFAIVCFIMVSLLAFMVWLLVWVDCAFVCLFCLLCYVFFG